MGTFKLACSGDTILLQPFPADYDGWKDIAEFVAAPKPLMRFIDMMFKLKHWGR